MNGRRANAKVPLHFVFGRRNTMHFCVLIYERQILSLPFCELGLVWPMALPWAKDINHFSAVKNNDVLLAWVIAGLNQPLTLSFALLLDLIHCIFGEIYPMAAVTEIGREEYFLRHGRSLAEDCDIFNGMSEIDDRAAPSGIRMPNE
jgi:hypothetical protein